MVEERHPLSLSGGQMQRVAIASAIAEDNDIILLDELTSGLDYKHMMDISEILKELQSMGKTIIVAYRLPYTCPPLSHKSYPHFLPWKVCAQSQAPSYSL